jgi:hypothetical protein
LQERLRQSAVERNALLKESREDRGWPVAAFLCEFSRCKFAGCAARRFTADPIAFNDERFHAVLSGEEVANGAANDSSAHDDGRW